MLRYAFFIALLIAFQQTASGQLAGVVITTDRVQYQMTKYYFEGNRSFSFEGPDIPGQRYRFSFDQTFLIWEAHQWPILYSPPRDSAMYSAYPGLFESLIYYEREMTEEGRFVFRKPKGRKYKDVIYLFPWSREQWRAGRKIKTWGMVFVAGGASITLGSLIYEEVRKSLEGHYYIKVKDQSNYKAGIGVGVAMAVVGVAMIAGGQVKQNNAYHYYNAERLQDSGFIQGEGLSTLLGLKININRR